MQRFTETHTITPYGVRTTHRVLETGICSDSDRLRERLRLSKESNAQKSLELKIRVNALVECEGELQAARDELAQSHRVTETYRQALAESDRDLKAARQSAETHERVGERLDGIIKALQDRCAELEAREVSPQDRECIALWRALPHDLAQDVATMAGAKIGQSIVDFTIRWAHGEMTACIQRGINAHNAAAKQPPTKKP